MQLDPFDDFPNENYEFNKIQTLEYEIQKLKEIIAGRTGDPEKKGTYRVKINYNDKTHDYDDARWDDDGWKFWSYCREEWIGEVLKECKVERWWEIQGETYE